MKLERNYTFHPDIEHRFFLYDPEGNGLMYFKTAEERDAYSTDVIRSCLDEYWSESVSHIIAGEVTHHTVRCNVELPPRRSEFDSDEEYEDAIEEFGDSDVHYKCDYKLAPLDVKDEPVPKSFREKP